MTIQEVKVKLEDMALLSPVITEALSMVSRGVSENLAFCWASLKLLEENELLKQNISETCRVVKLKEERIDKLNNVIMDLKDEVSMIKIKSYH